MTTIKGFDLTREVGNTALTTTHAIFTSSSDNRADRSSQPFRRTLLWATVTTKNTRISNDKDCSTLKMKGELFALYFDSIV